MNVPQRFAGVVGGWSAGRGVAKRWVGRGFWAIMDQGLFAVSNFGLNVLLARWLAPTDYGAFSVAYTIFLLLGTFHTAILTEPMLVFGPGKYKERLGAYLGVLLRGHWLFGALTGTLFAAAGLALWRFGHSPLTPAILGLAVAAPFILFQWLMRRACYVNLQPRLAASAGAIYMALMAAGVLGVYHYGWLGAATALLVMAAASLVSGLWLVYQLRVERGAVKGGELGAGVAGGSLEIRAVGGGGQRCLLGFGTTSIRYFCRFGEALRLRVCSRR